ncbi:hypothetical protein [Xanthobacter sp. KR7-225]|uniref:hypothetical protein n=1 Tax=Xanthobacter sp. KR7-225 TaxID=3156613 RepID=UPI0032B3BF59
MPLTDLALRNAKPVEKPYKLAAPALKTCGLGSQRLSMRVERMVQGGRTMGRNQDRRLIRARQARIPPGCDRHHIVAFLMPTPPHGRGTRQ